MDLGQCLNSHARFASGGGASAAATWPLGAHARTNSHQASRPPGQKSGVIRGIMVDGVVVQRGIAWGKLVSTEEIRANEKKPFSGVAGARP